jgi:hypothetical protein
VRTHARRAAGATELAPRKTRLRRRRRHFIVARTVALKRKRVRRGRAPAMRAVSAGHRARVRVLLRVRGGERRRERRRR